MTYAVPFNRPYMAGKELGYIAQAHAAGQLAGDGPFTKRCNAWLEQRTGSRKALLTHSCTAALEMAAILAGIGPGDEVIMPSFTFVSTANAFVLRGAVPVFVDIRPDTLNIDETPIEAAITPRTQGDRGRPLRRRRLRDGRDHGRSPRRHGLLRHRGCRAGRHGELQRPAAGQHRRSWRRSASTRRRTSSAARAGRCSSTTPRFVERAEIIREKGTNRSQFFRGQVDKYTWVDIGSSYLPERDRRGVPLGADGGAPKAITTRRLAIWERYHEAFAATRAQGAVRRPIVPPHCRHNAHMYYLLLPSLEARTGLIERLKQKGILAVFHYVPLGDSPAGRRFGRQEGTMDVTRAISDRLLRLPLWLGVEEHLPQIIDEVTAYASNL